eukprot:452116_1
MSLRKIKPHDNYVLFLLHKIKLTLSHLITTSIEYSESLQSSKNNNILLKLFNRIIRLYIKTCIGIIKTLYWLIAPNMLFKLCFRHIILFGIMFATPSIIRLTIQPCLKYFRYHIFLRIVMGKEWVTKYETIKNKSNNKAKNNESKIKVIKSTTKENNELSNNKSNNKSNKTPTNRKERRLENKKKAFRQLNALPNNILIPKCSLCRINKLIIKRGDQCYEGYASVSCDYCGRENIHGEVWHCNKCENRKGINGFNLCKTCGFLISHKRQNEIRRVAPPMDDMGLLFNKAMRNRNKTLDGFTIYKNDEIKKTLKIGCGGNTKLCPFDCKCCF